VQSLKRPRGLDAGLDVGRDDLCIFFAKPRRVTAEKEQHRARAVAWPTTTPGSHGVLTTRAFALAPGAAAWQPPGRQGLPGQELAQWRARSRAGSRPAQAGAANTLAASVLA
jgi:hypothetical protein